MDDKRNGQADFEKADQLPDTVDHNLSPVADNPCYWLKYRIFVFMVISIVTIYSVRVMKETPKITCLIDPVHNWTQGINNMINENHTFASTLQIISSAILDAAFISMSIYWGLYIRTFRFYVALLSFYAVRLVHLQLLQMRFAEGYYWEDPGVPSLVVKYGWLSDFFYSGHCGFLFLCAQEWRRVGQQKLFYLLLLCSFFQAFVVITFRIHYTLDVVPGGFVYCNWIYRLTCDYEVQIDFYNQQFVEWVTRSSRKNRESSKTLSNEVEVVGITPNQDAY